MLYSMEKHSYGKSQYTLYYLIIRYYITLHYITSYIYLLLIYNLLKGNNSKIILERSRLWQLDTSRREPCERG